MPESNLSAYSFIFISQQRPCQLKAIYHVITGCPFDISPDITFIAALSPLNAHFELAPFLQ